MYELPDDTTTRSPETCWRNRTPFQIGLILLLAVAVPFFVIMVIIYILSSVPPLNKSGQCSHICGILEHWKSVKVYSNYSDYPFDYDNVMYKDFTIRSPVNETTTVSTEFFGTKSCITTEDEEYAENTREKRSEEFCLKDKPNHPHIGALLENLYSDERTEQIFKCSVVVLSTDLLLTFEKCINNVTTLFVRINSNYWFKDGFLRKIEAVDKFENLTVIRLKEDPEYENCFKPVTISKDNRSSNVKLFSWNGNINRPLKHRSKFGDLKAFSIRVNYSGKMFSCYDADCSGGNGAPLVDEYQNLIGFQTFSFSYIAIEKYFDWLRHFL